MVSGSVKWKMRNEKWKTTNELFRPLARSPARRLARSPLAASLFLIFPRPMMMLAQAVDLIQFVNRPAPSATQRTFQWHRARSFDLH
jgi:hypothetical protein